jgi:hypothetical protein
MAGTISEGYLSRPFNVGYDNSSRELVFDIQGTDSEDDVLTLITGQAPTTYEGLVLSNIEAEPIGFELWKGHARYAVLDVEYTFDTGGGSAKITQSLATLNFFTPDASTPPNFQGAIGVSNDAVEGVEIPQRKYDFTETHKWLDTDMTAAYKQILYQLTGSVNKAAFKGLNAGECLFLGVTGSKRGNDFWSLTYRFSGSQNATTTNPILVAGMTITKNGWDYLWYRYGEFADTVGMGNVKYPTAAYVEQVFPIGDFSTLNIGI